jgi:hypothetical protein
LQFLMARINVFNSSHRLPTSDARRELSMRNFDIQPAMARPISSGESSRTNCTPATRISTPVANTQQRKNAFESG